MELNEREALKIKIGKELKLKTEEMATRQEMLELLKEFDDLMKDVEKIANVLGKTFR